ncbi:hypothetical protein FA13DRAFT_1753117 [Coprinellus micaceus]|uniref:Asl1-like glycosyl hydrolase catalytic domain-containing protein n=1 Tax=Coprinellus micaceus TaxID=71717 RepID=A0A4Y7TPP3_COPMI|nr:hypothetical protein FA13DRAFT_1753117 [Coprinellus micaceus]
MLHGPGQVGDFQKNVKAGFSNAVLGFNEPNQSGQSVMSPGEAIGLWRQYIQPLKSQGYTLVSPACTNAPSGLTWQRDFVNGCSGCNIDAIATHFYGTDAQALIDHLVQYHNAFGRNIWLTEYACQDFSGRNQQCSPDKTASFMRTTQAFMESQSWMSHYAYFGVLFNQNLGGVDPVNRLIYDNSYPTNLGKQYLGI